MGGHIAPLENYCRSYLVKVKVNVNETDEQVRPEFIANRPSDFPGAARSAFPHLIFPCIIFRVLFS